MSQLKDFILTDLINFNYYGEYSGVKEPTLEELMELKGFVDRQLLNLSDNKLINNAKAAHKQTDMMNKS